MRLAQLLLASILLVTATARAEVLQDEDDLKPFMETFMKAVAGGDLTAAFEKIRPYAEIPAAELDAAALQARALRDQTMGRVGPPTGYEFISSKKAGQSLVQIIYIEKTANAAVTWTFTFYHANKGWKLIAFNSSGDISTLFHE